MDNCACIELNRSWIEVKGADAKKFLNGLLTNDINKLQGKSGCYALLLTPKGKIIADCFCYTCGDTFGIDCEQSLKPVILEHLKKYIVFQKVELSDQGGDWQALGVIGPKAKEFLSMQLKELPTTEYTYLETVFGEIKLWVILKNRWGLPCYELWVKKSQATELKNKLNFPEISHEAQEILRIESGTPLFSIDFDQNSLPQEACLDEALSFDKGCYVGQEIVARLEHRGHVGKQLVQLFIEGNNPPTRGEKIFSDDGKEIGRITSSIFSPTDKKSVSLGIISYASLNLTEVMAGDLKAQIKSLVKDKVSK